MTIPREWGAEASTTPTQPRCLTCKDTGQVLAPYYSDFPPRLEWQPCPDCHPVKSMRIGTPWLIGLAAAFIAWVLWGAK